MSLESQLETACFVEYLDSRRLILYISIFTGGLLRGPDSGLKKACFVQNLDSSRLILYIFTFHIFTWGSVQVGRGGSRIRAQESL